MRAHGYWSAGVTLGPVMLHTQSWNPFTFNFTLNRKGQPAAFGDGTYSHTAWWLRLGLIAIAWRW